MSILKKVGPELAPEIAAIATACIRAGKWPEQRKKAEIVPIWKNKGNQQDPLFYRPISMLPAIARLIATAVDDGDVVLVASMDLAGAFDTLDREVLTRKLEDTCGIAGRAKELIQDYLKGRMQRVRKREEVGGWKENLWGVPQGSVLGPLLFSLYCADIGGAVRSASVCQYADDVTLTVTSETAQGAVEKMNVALAEFHEWATGNRLAAEPAKTQLMMCTSRKRRKDGEHVCKMGSHCIRPTEKIKVLGVLLDDRLSWEIHNAAAAGKASGIA
eukprot:gene17927-biopygen25986